MNINFHIQLHYLFQANLWSRIINCLSIPHIHSRDSINRSQFSSLHHSAIFIQLPIREIIWSHWKIIFRRSCWWWQPTVLLVQKHWEVHGTHDRGWWSPMPAESHVRGQFHSFAWGRIPWRCCHISLDCKLRNWGIRSEI